MKTVIFSVIKHPESHFVSPQNNLDQKLCIGHSGHLAHNDLVSVTGRWPGHCGHDDDHVDDDDDRVDDDDDHLDRDDLVSVTAEMA